MAKQINKIIFTTKEAYDQKVSEGTLDPSVVYTIDASQAVTNIEVKNAVDIGFEKFGLTLGIDEEKAKFYNISLSLADMIKDLVKEKFDAEYSNDTRKLVSNGTRDITISDVKPNSVVTIRQNGVDLGMVKYDLTYSGLYHNAAIKLPESVDLSTDFEVKLSNIFDTKSNTITFVPSLENIVKDALDNLSSDIDFDRSTPRVVSEYNNGRSGGSNYYIDFYQDTVEGKDQFSNNYYNLSSSGAVFVAIPDKSLLNSYVLNELENAITNGKYIVITDLGLTEYYDSIAKSWKAMPQDKNEILVKLRNYTNYPFNSISINNAKVTDILSKVNLSDINTGSIKSLGTAEISSTDEDAVANSEVLVYTNYSNTEEFIDALITLNTSKPLKVKAIRCLGFMTQSIIDKLASLPTLQLVAMNLSNKEYFSIPENFKPLLTVRLGGEYIYIEAVEGNGSYTKVPQSVDSVIRKF